MSASWTPSRGYQMAAWSLLPDSTNILNRDLVIALAARYRLPAVYAFRFFVAAGSLMSYGTCVQARQWHVAPPPGAARSATGSRLQ
jgi:hypothetical protein